MWIFKIKYQFALGEQIFCDCDHIAFFPRISWLSIIASLHCPNAGQETSTLFPDLSSACYSGPDGGLVGALPTRHAISAVVCCVGALRRRVALGTHLVVIFSVYRPSDTHQTWPTQLNWNLL